MRQTQRYYDDFSTSYDEPRHGGYHAMIEDLEVRTVVPLARGGRVLEAGCGTGRILARLANHARDACGVDLSGGMLAHARARGLHVLQGDLAALPFEDDQFDLVCSFKVLAHVPAVGQALAEMARVTRPGGHIAAEFYNPWSLRWLVKKVAGSRPVGRQHQEKDVFTRYDSPRIVPRLLPPGVELVHYRGVRVLTPTAAVHRLPWVSEVVSRAERVASRSRLRYCGGFLIAILRKRGA